VTSPQRSLVQDHAGSITVTGTVGSNLEGAAVDSVTVNNVPATVSADGAWTATIQVQQGASLIHTVALGHDGGQATDTRSVQAGELRAPGANIDSAISVSLSTDAFAKISTAAASIMKTLDISAMVQGMNPIQSAGGGPDCLYDQVFVDTIKFSDDHISLVPVAGGLKFSAEIDGGDVHAHVKYAAACIDGTENVRVTATKITITGTLTVTPKGNEGFDTKLNNPQVSLEGLNVDTGGLIGTIVNLINFSDLISNAVEGAAEKAMNPIMNSALGALSGPQKLDVLGHTIDVSIDPSAVSFDANGGLISLDTNMLIEGTENSPGFIFTDNGTPNLDPGTGFQLGLADDLANEILAQLNSLGILTFSLPVAGGTFDTTDLATTVPPMISANGADGKMQLVLGDMMMTFKSGGNVVGKAAVNATVDVQVVSASGGYAVGLALGPPTFNVDVLDDVANETHFADEDLGKAVQIGVGGQIESISKLLTSIPIPSVAGLIVKDLTVGGSDGYVMINGGFQ